MDSIKKLLPKTYFQRKRVAQEVYIVVTHYKNLMPVLDNYDTSYNIPVCLWLDESYPQTAPICYVKPTKDMVTVRGKHVDSNGEVMLPFLQEWSQETCDLVSLLQVISAVFGESPPVCVRPPQETAQETAQASCSLQFYRQAEGLDEDAQLFLTTEDDQPFHQDNETNC
ncbi:tumor susceptibility gene 101 protein isoform X2 [Gadus morhua]|uniref:tumor susceptibility gene 101 protein isoform X2 n=1 Tax=Gadus morhua TaxID=8049 RepID=UPI0011B4515A|nr:tumor susceptibility gene 101 protein-like isoform X2 [Gadus morhua]